MKNGDNLIHRFNSIEHSEGNFSGLTKREYFAIMAITSIDVNSGFVEDITKYAVNIADALLEELDKK